MNARYQTVGLMSLIAFVMVIGSGCGSHAVKYNVDSESMEEGMVAEGEQSSVPISEYWKNRSVPQGSHSNVPGATDPTLPYNRPPQVGGSSDYIAQMKKGDPAHESLQQFTPQAEAADYGHNYAGVSGRPDGHGPVTGFSDGTAPGMSTDPEEWSRAHLGGAYSGEGLSAEHVEQNMVIAQADAESAQGEMTQGRGGLYEDPQSLGFGSKDLEYVRGVSLNNGEIRDIFFEFDSWKISPHGAQALASDAEWLKANPREVVTIEGHCDERGTQNYNLVLGKKRAEATRDYLMDLGVKPNQLRIVSYGKERPFCSEQNENCYQQNRRGHVVTSMN